MNTKLLLIICLLAIIIINLAISYFLKTKEGLQTQSQLYSTSQQQLMKDRYGFSSGFSGSGTNIDNTKIDFVGLYGNSAPNQTSYNNITRYNANNFNNVQYHDDINEIQSKQEEKYGLTNKDVIVKDNTGNTVILRYPDVQGTVTYYEPGTYTFGASSYVPNYEDSIYLSRTTGVSTTTPITDTASMLAGFCKHYKNNPDKLEEMCKSTDKDKCGSTSCCVLLGGSKCVSGDENGPYMKANYSDIFIKNKDFYYFQGKCYGNCK